LTSKIEELERLVEEGTLEPIETTDRAAQKSIRICGDFPLTTNSVTKLDNYPIPKVKDFFQTFREARALLNWTSKKPTTASP